MPLTLRSPLESRACRRSTSVCAPRNADRVARFLAPAPGSPDPRTSPRSAARWHEAQRSRSPGDAGTGSTAGPPRCQRAVRRIRPPHQRHRLGREPIPPREQAEPMESSHTPDEPKRLIMVEGIGRRSTLSSPSRRSTLSSPSRRSRRYRDAFHGASPAPGCSTTCTPGKRTGQLSMYRGVGEEAVLGAAEAPFQTARPPPFQDPRSGLASPECDQLAVVGPAVVLPIAAQGGIRWGTIMTECSPSSSKSGAELAKNSGRCRCT
jgi:hypothetical protein